MGIIALAALLAYAAVAAVSIAAVVVSARKSAAALLYWAVALVSSSILPFLLRQPVPVHSGGEYGAFGYFVLGAFSSINLICALGAVASLLLARARWDVVRVLSGISWAFLVSYAVRIVTLL